MTRQTRQTERRTTTRRRTALAAAAVAAFVGLGVVTTAARADRITLKAEARVDRPAVTLADIADLEGERATALAEVELARFEDGKTRIVLSRRSVRETLADRGINWGFVALRGHMTTTIRQRGGATDPTPATGPKATIDIDTPTADEALAEPLATGDAAEANPVPHTISVSAEAGPPVDEPDGRGEAVRSLQTLVTEWIVARTGIGADKLRIDWRDTNDSLRALTNAAGRLEFDPHTSDPLGRLPLTVRQYEADRLIDSHRLMLEVEALLPAVIATDAIARGQTLTREDLTLRTERIDSMRHTPLASIDAAVGQVAARSLRRGDLLEADDVQPPNLVERGQLVTVRALSGGLVLKTVARAMESGQRDQVIKVRHPRSREVMHVRVSGTQEAVMLVGAGDADARSNATTKTGDDS